MLEIEKSDCTRSRPTRALPGQSTRPRSYPPARTLLPIIGSAVGRWQDPFKLSPNYRALHARREPGIPVEGYFAAALFPMLEGVTTYLFRSPDVSPMAEVLGENVTAARMASAFWFPKEPKPEPPSMSFFSVFRRSTHSASWGSAECYPDLMLIGNMGPTVREVECSSMCKSFPCVHFHIGGQYLSSGGATLMTFTAPTNWSRLPRLALN